MRETVATVVQLTSEQIIAACLITVEYCYRSDRESRREQIERMVTSMDSAEADKLNQTVTGAEPSSPCRVAARGKT